MRIVTFLVLVNVMNRILTRIEGSLSKVIAKDLKNGKFASEVNKNTF